MEGAADYSGWINKLSTKGFWKGSWKRKWAMLKGDTLNLYKSPSDPKSSRCVRLNDYTSILRATLKAVRQQFCLELNDSKNLHKSLFFQFDTKEEMRKWAALFRLGVKDKGIDMSLADKTGWLAVLGGKKMTKTWKRRWVVAQYSTLYLFKDEANAAHGTPSLVIDLSDYTKATVVDSARSGRPHTFHITTSHPNGTTHFLSALSETDFHDWLNFITPLLQTGYSPDEDVRAEATDDNNFYVASADSHFSIPSPTRPDFRILPLDHGHFATSWKELLVGHDPEGVETWRIPGWGRAVATSPDQSLLVATCGKVRQWAIFEAVAGEMVGNPVDHSEWLYSLAWLSSSRFIAASSMSNLYLFSVDGRLLKSWTKLRPNGGLVELSVLRKVNSNGKQSMTSLLDSDADETGYTMQVHCVAALRGDLAAVSEPSANAVWIADLQRGSVLQTIDFESPLDLTVTREGRTVVLGVDGRRHIGVITIYRHHISRSQGQSDRSSQKDYSEIRKERRDSMERKESAELRNSEKRSSRELRNSEKRSSRELRNSEKRSSRELRNLEKGSSRELKDPTERRNSEKRSSRELRTSSEIRNFSEKRSSRELRNSSEVRNSPEKMSSRELRNSSEVRNSPEKGSSRELRNLAEKMSSRELRNSSETRIPLEIRTSTEIWKSTEKRKSIEKRDPPEIKELAEKTETAGKAEAAEKTEAAEVADKKDYTERHYLAHFQRYSGKNRPRSSTISFNSVAHLNTAKFNTWSHDPRQFRNAAPPTSQSSSGGRNLKSNSDTLALAARPVDGEKDPKKSSEVLKLALPGGDGVRIPGNDTILCWKPLVHVSPSRRHLLVNDRTGLLWLYNISSLTMTATGNTTTTTNPPRHLGRSILGYVQDVLWLSDDAFLAITNLRMLFKVDLLLDAVVFSRCIL